MILPVYRRISDSDLFWMKKSVRLVGLFIVVLACLLFLVSVLLFIAKFPIDAILVLLGLTIGFIVGRESK